MHLEVRSQQTEKGSQEMAASFMCLELRRGCEEDCVKAGESGMKSDYKIVEITFSLEGGHAFS